MVIVSSCASHSTPSRLPRGNPKFPIFEFVRLALLPLFWQAGRVVNMEKSTIALKAANWRRSQVPHNEHTHQLKKHRKRNSSTSVTDFDIANPATYWRRPVAGTDPFQNTTNPVFGENKHELEKLDTKSLATARCTVVKVVPLETDGSS
ncbi:hypothetical protein LX36DRAFT_56272 [Colletotrichum falcatum]|nr:hypothetical protein LX36DRAFT_56272 [Colletotrichum falcatum]